MSKQIDLTKFGKALKKRWEASDFTLRGFAERCGCSHVHLTRLFLGSAPSIGMLNKLCEQLNVDPSTLISESEE